MHVPPDIRRAFRRCCLAEIEARYGPVARASAEAAFGQPDRLDLVGAALLAGVPPLPANATAAVERYAQEYGLDG